jgi:hypothetical protein
MGTNRKKLEKTVSELESIRKAARKTEKKYAAELDAVHPSYRKSAANLIHYLALRHQNLDTLQDDLERLGLSRLAKAESHIMASIVAVEGALKAIAGSKKPVAAKPGLSIKKGTKLLGVNTSALLGKKLKGSKARIMVTLPSEAADDKKLVLTLVTSGMNSARINCAHDDAQAWKRMINNIKAARRKTGRNCRICMDLGGWYQDHRCCTSIPNEIRSDRSLSLQEYGWDRIGPAEVLKMRSTFRSMGRFWGEFPMAVSCGLKTPVARAERSWWNETRRAASWHFVTNPPS